MENSVALENLLPFMNKKFFNYFVYYMPKSIVISNYEVYFHKSQPFICYLKFEDEKSKKEFIQKYSEQNYPGLT